MIRQEVTVKTLERLGYRVGEALIERVAKDVPRFKSELEAIVFMCKQFWVHTFNKPMDNLKTNHQVRELSLSRLLYCVSIGHVRPLR